jgi:hypothetical protein
LQVLTEAARHQHSLRPRFADLVDLLLGWALDPELPESAGWVAGQRCWRCIYARGDPVRCDAWQKFCGELTLLRLSFIVLHGGFFTAVVLLLRLSFIVLHGGFFTAVVLLLCLSFIVLHGGFFTAVVLLLLQTRTAAPVCCLWTSVGLTGSLHPEHLYIPPHRLGFLRSGSPVSLAGDGLRFALRKWM